MQFKRVVAVLAAITYSSGVSAVQIRSDPLTAGPELEVIHLYSQQWPTGIAVSSNGRKFSCFPAGLDPANTNHGLSNKYQVAELTSEDNETPYPSKEINSPPGGSVDHTSVPPVTKGLSDYLLGVQSVVIDSEDTLWILDTGRVAVVTDLFSPLLNATYGGTKLISVDLSTNKVTRTIVFPRDVALPQSYFNDVRFDNKRGFAYITDSSPEGFNALVTVNLKSGKSWRSLANPYSVTHPLPKVVPFVWGAPMYEILDPATQATNPGYITFGCDGIALDPTGETLYFSSIAGRYLYSLPTSVLRHKLSDVSTYVTNHGEKGISDGLETDSNGIIYGGNMEQDAISMFNPKRGLATIFVRDIRMNWVDTMSVATDGYLYFTINQLNYLQAIYPGKGLPLIDRRQPPYVLFRAKLPNGGTKINP